MAADFGYYELAHPEEGVGSGFRYKTVPHVTLKSVANNPEIREGMSRELLDATIARYAEPETLTVLRRPAWNCDSHWLGNLDWTHTRYLGNPLPQSCDKGGA